MSMPNSAYYFLAAIILLLACLTVAEAAKDYEIGWSSAKTTSCQGSIAECMGSADEMAMDSEINRRVLATADYISYGALESNTVPCSQKGASYYNCQEGAEANPYDRGCSELARCRS